jgi:hypothetical protein
VNYFYLIGIVSNNVVTFNKTEWKFSGSEERDCFYLHTLIGGLKLVATMSDREIFGLEGSMKNLLSNELPNDVEMVYGPVSIPDYLDGKIIINEIGKPLSSARYVIKFPKKIVWDNYHNIIMFGETNPDDMVVRVCRNLYVSIREGEPDGIIVKLTNV